MSTIKSSAENLTLNADGANNDVIIQSNASTKVTVDGATGNVGIGTSSPTGNLEVATTASDTGVSIVIDGNRTSNGGVGSIVFNNSGDSVGMIRSNRASANDAADMLFYTQATGGANTQRMEIANTGDVTVNTGNLVIGTAGKGIDFSATSGSGTSELLDDYEEGTWTPSFGATPNPAYSTQVGTYVKIGNKVHVQGRVVLTSLGTLSGGMAISGLPFTTSSVTNNFSSGSVAQLTSVNITAGYTVAILVSTGATTMSLNIWDVAAGTTGLTATEFSASGNMLFSAEYTV